MRKWICFISLVQIILSLGEYAYADEYSNCRKRCIIEDVACRTEIPETESKAQKAIETTCEMELDACNADCDELRSITGIVKMLME